MSYAPQTLLDLQALWVSKSGVPLGIVGDTAHQHAGTSYHLGADALIAGAYSAVLPRDKAGLTNAASAIDLGKLYGSLTGLQTFSRWLVFETRAHPKGIGGYGDIREIIYSPDGLVVKRWDNELRALRDGGDGTGQGDNTHLTHTHISFYRDSEHRDKRPLFAPYFELPDTATGDPVGLHIETLGTKDATPLDAFATARISGAGHSIFRVSDARRVAVADGLDLGTVEHARFLTLPTWANGDSDCVAFNYAGDGQHVAVIRDVVVTALPVPPAPADATPFSQADLDAKAAAAAKTARGLALEQAHIAGVKGAGDAIDALPR